MCVGVDKLPLERASKHNRKLCLRDAFDSTFAVVVAVAVAVLYLNINENALQLDCGIF